MIVKRVYSPDIYRKIMNADQDKKEDIYRYELMLPFKGKWDCFHIPIKASREGACDVIMANNRMGIFPPSRVNRTTEDWIEAISGRKLLRIVSAGFGAGQWIRSFFLNSVKMILPWNNAVIIMKIIIHEIPGPINQHMAPA